MSRRRVANHHFQQRFDKEFEAEERTDGVARQAEDHHVPLRTEEERLAGLHPHLMEVRGCDDIGEGGLNVVRRDMDRCRRVLVALQQEDPEGRAA